MKSHVVSDGIKHGWIMATNSRPEVEMISEALSRLSVQWDRAIGRADIKTPRNISRTHDEVHVEFTRLMSAEDRRKLGEWFMDRYNYLQEEYRLAINERDNIFGKQWLYDQRPRLKNELP